MIEEETKDYTESDELKKFSRMVYVLGDASMSVKLTTAYLTEKSAIKKLKQCKRRKNNDLTHYTMKYHHTLPYYYNLED